MTVTLILSLGLLALLCGTSPRTKLVLAKHKEKSKDWKNGMMATKFFQKSKEWTNEPECGSPKFKLATHGRIVGGANARAHSWPWQALLICQNEQLFLNCGGTLIARRWIITAAHCLTAVLEAMVVQQNCVVMLGKHHADRQEVMQQTCLISEYIIHENYSTSQPQRGNDLALVKLDREVSYNYYVQPVCLPYGLPELSNQSNCYATGWGRFVAEKREMSPQLKQLFMPIEDAVKLCGIEEKYANAHVCAGRWQRGEDVCNGDSGGPLTCKEDDGKWYLRGVTSLGDMLCRSYGIFAKVNLFKDWIESNISTD